MAGRIAAQAAAMREQMQQTTAQIAATREQMAQLTAKLPDKEKLDALVDQAHGLIRDIREKGQLRVQLDPFVEKATLPPALLQGLSLLGQFAIVADINETEQSPEGRP